MKTNIRLFLKSGLIMLLAGLMLTFCKKDNEDDPVFEESYWGTLTVNWKSTYPPWDVTSSMGVEISEERVIVIEPNTLLYSGEKLVSDDSKLTRNGWWDMSPTGEMVDNVDQWGSYIYINANIMVMEDVTRVYAKDNYGNWVLVGTAPFMGDVPAELAFRFDLAITDDNGHSINVQESTGAITWTLALLPQNPAIP